MKSVLIDNSLYSHSIIEDVSEESYQASDEPRRSNRLAVAEIRDEYGRSQEWLDSQVRAIPTLRKLAIEGYIKLFFTMKSCTNHGIEERGSLY
jgi:hypothetical protein